MGDKMDLVWQVHYKHGILVAKGKKDGKVVCTKEMATSSSPAKIQLLADRTTIKADGQDVVDDQMHIFDLFQAVVGNYQTNIDQLYKLPALKTGQPDGCGAYLLSDFHTAQHIGRVAAATNGQQHIPRLD